MESKNVILTIGAIYPARDGKHYRIESDDQIYNLGVPNPILAEILRKKTGRIDGKFSFAQAQGLIGREFHCEIHYAKEGEEYVRTNYLTGEKKTERYTKTGWRLSNILDLKFGGKWNVEEITAAEITVRAGMSIPVDDIDNQPDE